MMMKNQMKKNQIEKEAFELYPILERMVLNL